MIQYLHIRCSWLLIWEKKNEVFIDIFLCVFFCLYPSDQAQWVLSLISMLHSVTLHLCLRFHSLLMRRELKRVICWWMSFVYLLSFALTFDIELSECCVWFQCFAQRCCSTISNTVTCRYKEKKQVICWWMSFYVSSFFCLYPSCWAEWVLCLISMLHSAMLLLRL